MRIKVSWTARSPALARTWPLTRINSTSAKWAESIQMQFNSSECCTPVGAHNLKAYIGWKFWQARPPWCWSLKPLSQFKKFSFVANWRPSFKLALQWQSWEEEKSGKEASTKSSQTLPHLSSISDENIGLRKTEVSDRSTTFVRSKLHHQEGEVPLLPYWSPWLWKEKESRIIELEPKNNRNYYGRNYPWFAIDFFTPQHRQLINREKSFVRTAKNCLKKLVKPVTKVACL